MDPTPSHGLQLRKCFDYCTGNWIVSSSQEVIIGRSNVDVVVLRKLRSREARELEDFEMGAFLEGGKIFILLVRRFGNESTMGDAKDYKSRGIDLLARRAAEPLHPAECPR